MKMRSIGTWGLLVLTQALLLLPAPAVAQPDDDFVEPEPAIRDVVVSGVVYSDTNGNGQRDEGEAGAGSVWVSDGEAIETTAADGSYKLTMKGMDEVRCIHVTPPPGHRCASPWYQVIRQDETATDYACHFGIRPASRSRDRDFRFLVTADSQFSSKAGGELLKADFAQVSSISGSPRFHFICGDLTMTGWLREWRWYADARKAMTIPHYDVFGGHGGNYGRATRLKRGSVHHYNLFCGPSYYSWHYGGRHFVVADHVHSHTSAKQQARQRKWMAALIKLLPAGSEIVYAAHYATSLDEWRERHKVLAFFYGHHHESTLHYYKGTPYICTNAIRGSDWGMFTRAVQVCDFRNGRLLTQIRPTGQYERLEIAHPQPDGKVRAGVMPLRIMALDTASRIESVRISMKPGKAGKTTGLNLDRLGYWTWGCDFDASNVPSGSVSMSATVVDDRGRSWGKTSSFGISRGEALSPATGEDWPGFLKSDDELRTVARGPAPPLDLVWTANTGGRNEVGPSPIVYRGRVYCGTQNEDTGGPRPAVACYESESGELVWRTEVGTSIRFAPVAMEGRIVAQDNDGMVYGFDADTGDVIWRTPMPRQGSYAYHTTKGPVMQAGDLAVASTRRGPVMLLDPGTGKVVQTCPNPGSGSYYAAPLVRGKRVYISARYVTFCCDLETGKVIWRTDTKKYGSRGVGTPIFHKGVLYHNTAARVLAIDPDNGEIRWAAGAAAGGWAAPTPTVADGILYTGGVGFYAVDIATGKAVWSHRFEQPEGEAEANRRQRMGGFSSPAVAGECVFVGSDNGAVYALDKEEGTVRWQFRIGIPIKSSPVISGTMLFIKDYDGNLYAFSGRAATEE